MPRIHFVTFATPAFRMRQWLLNRSARWFGKADRLHPWTQAKLVADGFTARHSELFPHSTGYGWYAWKPYIILQALREADEGDLVIYQDVGRREPVIISHPLQQWGRYLLEHNQPCIAGVQIPDWGPNRLWTKKAAFNALGLQGDRYEDAPQIQASWSIWRKSPLTEAFVREWAECCQCLDLIGGKLAEGIESEVAGFKEHRWDQSLLTLLALREDLPILNLSARREPGLNEKHLDSFGSDRDVACGVGPFMVIVRAYYWLELTLKKIGFVWAWQTQSLHQ